MMDLRIFTCSLVCLLTLLGTTSKARQFPSEQIHAHVSHSIAVAGETIWLQCFSSTNEGPSASRIAYAELVNREGEAVQQVMFDLENGKAFSHLQIPTDIPSDHYLLRIYTRISPILNESGVFNQFLTIINPKSPPPQIGKSVPGSYRFIKSIHNPALNKVAAPKTAVNIDIREFDQQELMVSASLINPFLPEEYQGYISGQIYETPGTQPLIPELYGHIIYAKTKESFREDETIFLSAHGKQSVLNSAKPNSKGELFFELGPMKSYDYIIMQSADFTQQLAYSVVSPFIQLKFKPDFKFPVLELKEEDRPFLSELVVAGKISAYFSPVSLFEPLPIVTGFVADKTYLLDDFTRFENLEVTLREYVPEVLVRKRERKTIFKLLNNPVGAVFEENPLLMIDAMPVFDSDQLAAFDPKKIKKLEVLSREFSFNQDKYAGVLSFTTFDNDFGGYELPANALYLNYPSLQPNWKPDLNKNINQPHFPDYRNALVWESLAPGEGNGVTIYTSKMSGNYEIRISKRKGTTFEMFSGKILVGN
jgi:hypothetical protein